MTIKCEEISTQNNAQQPEGEGRALQESGAKVAAGNLRSLYDDFNRVPFGAPCWDFKCIGGDHCCLDHVCYC
jgi:hypothetical protein